MTKALKIRKVGNALGITLPKHLLEQIGAGEGDALYPIVTVNGIEFSRFDPDFEEALESSRDFMRRYPNAMKKLAE
jgi:putative addiction module antidote